MRTLCAALVCVLALGACSRDPGYAGGAKLAEAPAAAVGRSAKPSAMLAYEHSIEVEAQEKQVPQLFASAQQMCTANAEDACVVLESRISAGEGAHATLKFRAKSAGIARLIDGLSKQAEVRNRSSLAEDLAAPIGDANKKLQMLKDYRAKLEALQGRATADVDSLIKLTRELAQVQSEIEALSGRQAKMMERVETEILTVHIQSAISKSLWRPIGKAASEFGSNLSSGAASTIVATAFILPWAVFLLLAAWGIRKLWRLWRRPSK
jgi:hypothetical protein